MSKNRSRHKELKANYNKYYVSQKNAADKILEMQTEMSLMPCEDKKQIEEDWTKTFTPIEMINLNCRYGEQLKLIEIEQYEL